MDGSVESTRDIPQTARNRKRILDASEVNEEEASSRRPNFVSEWQDSFKSRCGPNKKGFIENETQFNDIIDQRLADNFEDSLTGLGVNLSNIPFNMSETMMALPSLMKQEETSPTHSETNQFSGLCDESSQSNSSDRFLKLLNLDSLAQLSSPSIHQILQQHVLIQDTRSNTQSPNLSQCEGQNEEDFVGVTINEVQSEEFLTPAAFEDNRFQYILGAPTSGATKINEESITYLNQGQSYEIKVKKLGDITRCQGKYYHSKIRVCFHERRLQFMEKEQIASWKQMRPGEKILEVDVPLSYGITDVIQDTKSLNICEFDWEPSKEVGIYIKVNCISTEFTPKKHGGEKGVPFRLQVENYIRADNGLERVHACSCQIKVFKLKGADRKHKQDKEKILKRPPSEQEKFQPQCECTILQEQIANDSGHVAPSEEETPSPDNNSVSPPSDHLSINTSSQPVIASPDAFVVSPQASVSRKIFSSPSSSFNQEDCAASVVGSPADSIYYNKALHTSATSTQTQAWLSVNRFSKHASIFANFTGNDILRLSRIELKEICGLADGIRMFNALHAKSIIPRLTLYVCPEYEQLYNAVYLENLSWSELVRKVCPLLHIAPESVQDVYLQGPSDINILVTDEVIMNLPQETMFFIKIVPDSSGERLRLILRMTSHTNNSTTDPL